VKLSAFLLPTAIKLRLSATDKRVAIEELLDLLVRQGAVGDRDAALADLLTREARMSTGMEQGLAIPHAKTGSVKKLTVALGLAPEGVEFQSLDGEPAQVIFLVLSAVGSRGPHIECLAEIARVYSMNGARELLLGARTSEEILAVLAGTARSYARS
jgi:mannitol/fructose-specific phosphotransferase system IIA component (Ntr-type)